MAGTTSDVFLASKDLLRSMLRAWYDLAKEEANAWTAQLKEESARQQNMSKPVQKRFVN